MCSAPLDAPGAAPNETPGLPIDFVGWGIFTWVFLLSQWLTLKTFWDYIFSRKNKVSNFYLLARNGWVRCWFPPQKMSCELVPFFCFGCQFSVAQNARWWRGKIFNWSPCRLGTRRVKRHKPGTFFLELELAEKNNTKMQVNGSLVVKPVNGCFGYLFVVNYPVKRDSWMLEMGSNR